MNIAGYVNNGSSFYFQSSQYISTTRDLSVVQKYAAGGKRIVRIDLSLKEGIYYDISSPAKAAAGLINNPFYYAVIDQEVLAEGFVPKAAMMLM